MHWLGASSQPSVLMEVFKSFLFPALATMSVLEAELVGQTRLPKSTSSSCYSLTRYKE